MGNTLGILFGQKRVVINDQSEGYRGALGGLTGVLRQTLGGVAGIVVDATVSEEHLSEVELTDNPVEDGVVITDHVHVKPVQLTIQGVISDTPLGYAVIGNIQNLVRSVSSLFGASSRSIDAYNDMLKLQKSRQPFTVMTGLKRYENMILVSLSVPRTAATGRAIHFNAVMRQINIVKSKSSTVSFSSAIKDLASPVQDKGNKLTPVVEAGSKVTANAESNSSILSRLIS